MSFKSLMLRRILKGKYEMIMEEGGEYATILMRSRLMMPVLPILESGHGLDKSEYTRIGPAKNSSGRFGCILVYKKKGIK
jgi:hypothetical protein